MEQLCNLSTLTEIAGSFLREGTNENNEPNFEELELTLSEIEVFFALRALGPDKALGPDGIPSVPADLDPCQNGPPPPVQIR